MTARPRRMSDMLRKAIAYSRKLPPAAKIDMLVKAGLMTPADADKAKAARVK